VQLEPRRPYDFLDFLDDHHDFLDDHHDFLDNHDDHHASRTDCRDVDLPGAGRRAASR
jgi:hypothetical protein